jgi:hypothetical protein
MNDTTRVFGNLPAHLDSHGSQNYEITWLLLEHTVFHETPQGKVTWIK